MVQQPLYPGKLLLVTGKDGDTYREMMVSPEEVRGIYPSEGTTDLLPSCYYISLADTEASLYLEITPDDYQKIKKHWFTPNEMV